MNLSEARLVMWLNERADTSVLTEDKEGKLKYLSARPDLQDAAGKEIINYLMVCPERTYRLFDWLVREIKARRIRLDLDHLAMAVLWNDADGHSVQTWISFGVLEHWADYQAAHNVNMMQYTAPQFLQLVRDEQANPQAHISKRQAEKARKKGGKKLIIKMKDEGGEFEVWKFTEYAVFAPTCQDTKWCVRGANYWNHYKMGENNPVYQIIKDGKPFALLHYGSRQLKNVDDYPLSIQDVQGSYYVFRSIQDLVAPLNTIDDADRAAFDYVAYLNNDLGDITSSEAENLIGKAKEDGVDPDSGLLQIVLIGLVVYHLDYLLEELASSRTSSRGDLVSKVDTDRVGRRDQSGRWRSGAYYLPDSFDGREWRDVLDDIVNAIRSASKENWDKIKKHIETLDQKVQEEFHDWMYSYSDPNLPNEEDFKDDEGGYDKAMDKYTDEQWENYTDSYQGNALAILVKQLEERLKAAGLNPWA